MPTRKNSKQSPKDCKDRKDKRETKELKDLEAKKGESKKQESKKCEAKKRETKKQEKCEVEKSEIEEYECKPERPAICPPTLPINFTVGNTAKQEGVVKVINGTQTQRLFRNGVASTCATQKPCPGPLDVIVPYTSLVFDNPGRRSACVTVTVTNLTPELFLFSHAHLKRYDPEDVCRNYLGDAGFSAAVRTYQFVLPSGAKKFAIVLEGVETGVEPARGTVTISGLACQTASVPAALRTTAPGTNVPTVSTAVIPPVPGPDNDLPPVKTASP